MTLRPIKAKHSSIRRARRHARLSRGASWGDFKPSLPSSESFTRKKVLSVIIAILIIWLASGFFHPLGYLPSAHADFNSTFSHTRTPIASCTTSSGCFTTARWTYNSTCVNNNVATWLNFSYSLGGTGSGGRNCASASIAVLNSPFNLQTASGKQLEIYVDWRNTVNTNTRETLASVILRTNGTLPSFGENWNPSADPSVKFRWDICPANLGCNSGNGQMDTYITHTDTGTVNSEAGANIDVISGNAACVAPHDCVFQEVLNFTGPTNFYFQKDLVAGSSTSSSTTSASGLQQGRDYYLFLKVGWNTGVAPTAGANVLFVSNTFDNSIPGILTWTFASVPSSCNDAQAGNQKLAACGSLGNPAPSFDINPLDPSSWANAIIKGMVWAATQALNAVLSFAAFIAPGLQIGLAFLEGFYRTLFDFLGNLIWPNSNLGTAIFNELANFVSWMVDSNNGLLAAFGNSTAIFGRFVDALKVTFPWLPTALAIALNLLTLAVNSVGEVITLVSLAMTLIVGGFAFYVLFFYFVYVGDDALGGVLGWMETMQWLIFNIGLAWTARISNYGIDIITAVIGIIPKPFVQMVAHQIPRIPIIETNARFVAPSFDFGEARAGNIFSFALWSIGLDFLAWYESRNPALPGSIGALIPNAVTPLLALNGMLPFLNLIVVISWGACIAWMGTRALALAGLDITSDMPLSVGPGRKISSGPKGFKISKHTKRFQGKLEKQGKHFQGRLARKVGERVNEAEKEKKITEAFREAARKNEADIQSKKARATGERIAKEELARRQKAEPGAE